MSLHQEHKFEDGICDFLSASGWLYEHDSWSRYDRARAVFVDDLVLWVRETQKPAWESLEAAHGPSAGTLIADRLRAAMDK